ncbi:MAG: response regulator [Sandaracinaceae bacterium]|nr:response regulator [Sandaracinaceae bacterium]
MLALVETYCDLVGNSRNPYRKVLSAPQALSVVRELSGTLFDPTLADLLRHVVLGEDTSQATGRTRALIVDPDPEETTVLEMRLLEHGFAVSVARDLAAAREQIKNDPPDVVVTEVDLGGGQSGFELPRVVGELPEEQRPAVVFLTTHSDRESVSRAFDLGAADYIVKPASAELVATKMGQVAQSSGAGRPRA